MAPSRKARRPQAPQPPPQPSDYDTDAPTPAAHAHVPPPPPRSNDELNLAVLQRRFPNVVAVRHVANYAVIYVFNLESSAWEKIGVEGTLFYCELAPAPAPAARFSAIILNRKGLDDFRLDIASHDQIEISDPYIIVQADRIYGIWVFSEPDSSTAHARDAAADTIQMLAKQAALADVSAHPRPPGSVESVPMGRQLSLRELFAHASPAPALEPIMHAQPQQHDILGQLFLKAKQDYNGAG